MKSTPIEEQFERLRARVESAVSMPATVVVSSACNGDGKTLVAFGLASSLSASGYRTLVLDADHLSPSVDDSRGPSSLAQLGDMGPIPFAHGEEGGFHVISLVKEQLRRSASRPSVEAALVACAASYDVVIVDTANLLDSTLAMLFARSANALIVAIREGRSVKRADHDLVRMLEREMVAILGTVSVSAKSIRDFGRREARRASPISPISSVETATRRQRATG